jgi:hypothetical protein
VKKIANLPFLIIFLTSMSLGFRAGSNFILPGNLENLALPGPAEPKQLSILGSGQRSILVVVVDALESDEPNLESAWLVLYLPENPRITLMPVFPTISRDIGSDENIVKRFAVDRSIGPPVLSEDFLNYMKDMEFWWSGYILMDNEALRQISVSLVAPGTQGKWKPAGEDSEVANSPTPLQLPLVWEAGRTSAAEQARYFQELCKRAAHYTTSGSEVIHFDIPDLIPDHFNLDFYIEQLNMEIKALTKHGSSLSCEFPLFYSHTITIR